MVGMERLENLQNCCVSAIREGIPGDFVETGVWRGAVEFDSFRGLPEPDPQSFPADEGDMLWAYSYLAVSIDQVKSNFERYELPDDRTRFIPGWFRKTIPQAELDCISVLRLDGDLYESTWLVLTHFYEKVPSGGFVIVDDYGAITACKRAVDEFREKNSIVSPITAIDWTGVFWRK